MNKFFAFAFSIFLSVSVFAQSVTFDSVCKNLSAHPNTTGDFTQVRKITKAKRTLSSSGTFIFSLDGIMWKTLKPFPSSLVINKTSVVQTAPDGKQTVIDASNNQIFTSISTTLTSVFSGKIDSLEEIFSVNFFAEGNTWKALLTPKDESISAVLKTLELNGTQSKDEAAFSSIILTDAGGDTTTYTFTNQKYPKELSANEKAIFTTK